MHSIRTATGVFDSGALPITDYTERNVTEAVAAIKELTEPADIRAVIAYEEANKNRQRVVAASRTRLAVIAQQVAGNQLKTPT